MDNSIWEFRDNQGYKWLITKNEDNTLNHEVVTYAALLPDWELIDQLKAEGKLFFVKEHKQ